MIGDVAGRLCILTDDMIDSGGTITCAAEMLLQRGATEVWAMATHGVLSGPAVDRLKNAPISASCSPTPAAAAREAARQDRGAVDRPAHRRRARAVFDDTSVSEIFGGENQG